MLAVAAGISTYAHTAAAHRDLVMTFERKTPRCIVSRSRILNVLKICIYIFLHISQMLLIHSEKFADF